MEEQCLYRHPKAPAVSFDYICNMLQLLCISRKNFFILGDLNDELLVPGRKLSKIYKNNKLTQIIDKPSRVTNTTATLLDVKITNNPNIVISHDVVPNTVGDHDLIAVKVDVSKPKRQQAVKTFRQLTYYTKDVFSSSLVNESRKLNEITLTDDMNAQVNIFKYIC